MSFIFKQFYLHLIHEKNNLANIASRSKHDILKQSSIRKAFALITFGGVKKTIAIAERLSLLEPFGFGAENLKQQKSQNFCYKVRAIANNKVFLETTKSRVLLEETLLKLKTLASFKQSLMLFSNSKSNYFQQSVKKQVAKTITKKLLDLFNQRIFHHSFKNNYVLHFQQGITEPITNKQSRNSHKMDLFTWSPVLDLPEVISTKAFSTFQPTTSLSKTKLALQLPVRSANQGSRVNKAEQQVSHSEPAFMLNQLKIRASTNKNNHIFLSYRSKNLDTGVDGFLVDENESYKADTYPGVPMRVPISGVVLKKLFDNVKKRLLLACPSLSKFYCADWLLESIKTQLISGNNIKRVLNQSFLLAQQPVCNLKQLVELQAKKEKNQHKNITWLQELKQLEKYDFKVALNWNSESLNQATVIPYLIKGLRITFSGRVGGKKGMAKTLTKSLGRVPQSTLTEKIDFAKGVVQTKTGSLGVKVWICYN